MTCSSNDCTLKYISMEGLRMKLFGIFSIQKISGNRVRTWKFHIISVVGLRLTITVVDSTSRFQNSKVQANLREVFFKNQKWWTYFALKLPSSSSSPPLYLSGRGGVLYSWWKWTIVLHCFSDDNFLPNVYLETWKWKFLNLVFPAAKRTSSFISIKKILFD